MKSDDFEAFLNRSELGLEVLPEILLIFQIGFQVSIALAFRQVEGVFVVQFRRRAPVKEIVEDMEVPLCPSLIDHPCLLQEILRETRTGHPSLAGEQHLQVLAEPGRVVVDERASVAEAFDQRIDLENLLLQAFVRGVAEIGQLLNEKVRGLRLSRATFTGDDDVLILGIVQHRTIGEIGQPVDMRRFFTLNT